jgi:hypothetical protein
LDTTDGIQTHVPHPEERALARVSKDADTISLVAILRDARKESALLRMRLIDDINRTPETLYRVGADNASIR